MARAAASASSTAPLDARVPPAGARNGPGNRAHDAPRGNLPIVLLCGGDKASQARDIAVALMLAKEV